MGFIYLIHSLNWGEHLEDGKRNCRTVMMGMFCYTLLYVFLRQYHHSFGVFTDGITTGLFLMFLTDLFVMAYTYKAYYGRNVLNELVENEDQEKWVFDKVTHKYRRPTDADIANAKANLEREERTERIRNTKSKIRAAIFIQRWWRDKLYSPPTGILYKRAQNDWNSKVDITR